MKVNRRDFFRRAATVSVGGGALAGYYVWQVEPYWVEITERSLPLEGLPTALEGKTLVQISDLHVGPTDASHLRRAVDQAMELKPDLVAVTGDAMTCLGGEQLKPTIELLRQLRPDDTPVFFVNGNHDYGAGRARRDVADELVRRLRGIGIQALQNEHVEHEGLQIIGCEDLWSGRFDPVTPLLEFDVDRDGLALVHNPDSVDADGWAGFRGWVLAGHTHGGQCRAPGIGAPIVPVANKRYTAGEFQLSGNRRMYINRGLGYAKPVRFLCRPEITQFRLTAAV